jgi:O-antigen ligase
MDPLHVGFRDPRGVLYARLHVLRNGTRVRHALRPELTPVMLRGLALGAIYATYVALEQRYVQGMLRCRGPMPHSNTLSMSINLFAPTWVALLLVGRGGLPAVLALGGGAICVVLAQSRTSLVLFGVAGVLTFAGSVRRRFDGRKVRWALFGLLAATALLSVSLDSILDRFAQAPKESAEARDHFNEAAALMLGDHPLLGIGINQYSHVLSAGGYADTVGVLEIDRHGVAHHLYWLTLAELGALGFLAYLALLLPPMFRAAGPVLDRRLRGDVRADVLLGLGAGYLVTHVQGFAEWVLRQSEMSQLFWISVAIVEGLRTQLGRR